MNKTFKIYLLTFTILIVAGFILYLTYGHGAAVLWLNDRHTPALDVFFKYLTYLGDGVALGVLILILLIFKRRYGYVMLMIGVVQALISWTLKRVVFGKVPRPKKYFDEDITLNFVEGVEVHGWYAFPSGHTITIFSIVTFLALMTKRPLWGAAFAIIGFLTAMSRMYLLQHFLIDVLVGAVIGTLISYVCMNFTRKYLEPETR